MRTRISATEASSDRASHDGGVVTRVVASPDVLSAVHGDRTILLNLRTQQYLGLDDVGSVVWASVRQKGEAGQDISALLDALESAFDAPRSVLESDLAGLLGHLRREKAIRQPAIAARAPVLAPASRLRCGVALLAAVLALRLLSLRRSLGIAAYITGRMPATATATPDLLAETARRIDIVAAFFPGRALCLEQSLALYLCLRRLGLNVRMRVGVQPYPFAAHAWVEFDGSPVGESRDRIQQYVPLFSLPSQRCSSA